MKKFLLLVFPSFLLFACTAFNSPAQSQIANETLTIFSVAKTIARKATVSSHEDRILIDNCAVGCPIGESGKTITRKTYTLNNNSQTKFANWVAYKITKNSLGSNCARTWRIDPLLNPNDTLAPKDYIGANRELQVDRGHQAPLASLCGLEGHDSLNYLSNITPQKSALNQGPWERLEDQERKLIRRDDVTAVYSVTGTLYEKFIDKLPNAMKEHAIPSGYWKVIFINVSPAVNHCAAFVFQQEASNSADFCTYQTTVSEIEARTGLNIWSSVPTEIQTYIKSTPGLLPRLLDLLHFDKAGAAGPIGAWPSWRWGAPGPESHEHRLNVNPPNFLHLQQNAFSRDYQLGGYAGAVAQKLSVIELDGSFPQR